MPRSVDEWMQRLQSKSLKFLHDQTSPHVRGYNGAEHDIAVDTLIKNRINNGERIERTPRPTYILTQADDKGEVEIIPFGGKGGTIRIVHPRVTGAQ